MMSSSWLQICNSCTSLWGQSFKFPAVDKALTDASTAFLSNFDSHLPSLRLSLPFWFQPSWSLCDPLQAPRPSSLGLSLLTLQTSALASFSLGAQSSQFSIQRLSTKFQRSLFIWQHLSQYVILISLPVCIHLEYIKPLRVEINCYPRYTSST